MIYVAIAHESQSHHLCYLHALDMGVIEGYNPLLPPWLQVAGYGNKYLRQNGEETRITAKQVEESVNGSLSRLGTDHIDLLQVGQLTSPHCHIPGIALPCELLLPHGLPETHLTEFLLGEWPSRKR